MTIDNYPLLLMLLSEIIFMAVFGFIVINSEEVN